ncbi:MAG TPA: mannitol dehydrogenase family protein [Chloroflexia bacterium]|nr:mannitol dehydrogenase family protein [Chloroflexia bacterium]
MDPHKPLIPVQYAHTLPAVATFPLYDRSNLGCGIAHIGVGNFHRAHQALYLHEYLQTHPHDWMVHGVGLLDSDVDLFTAMTSQDCLYTLTERSGTQDTLKVIGSIKRLSLAPAGSEGVIRLLASADIKIVSLTITEKGYYYTASSDLDADNPVIRADLAGEGAPRSAFGYLYAAAAKRMAEGGPAFTVMSCDNLPGNGHMTRRLLLQFAEMKDPAVARWIGDNVAFPNSMVDRITPAVTDKTTAFVRDTFGVDDRCPVVSEAYLQWVLEDNFAAGRPALEEVGVQVTSDVEPYEKLKVRLLNGSHSALSYPAYLMGYREVDAAMRDPAIRAYVQQYMDVDITPTVPPVPGIDLAAYKQTLVERFSNPAISDQVQRLAMDGSAKARNAWVPPLEHQLATGGSIRWLAFALAAWYRYLYGTDEAGDPIEIADPLRDELVARARSAPDDPTALLSMREIFGERPAADGRLAAAVKESLDAIRGTGTRQALERLLRQ